MSARAAAARTVVLALGLVACSGAPSAPRAPEARPKARLAFTDADIDRTLFDVMAAREIRPARKILIERLPKARFVERLKERIDPPPAARGGISAEAGFLLGFDFVPEPSRRAGIAPLDEVLAEEIVGFYDKRDDKVYVPERTFATEDDVLHQRAVLAHEIEHALQAQSLPKLREPQNRDERIAFLSLEEGDAMAAMGAAIGLEEGAPVKRTLRRLSEVVKRVPLDKLSRRKEPRAIDRALELTRERLEFPYGEGMRFVSDLVRAGGFALVDRAWASPPSSTTHVLHPNKYLAGELPRTIADPEPLPGERLVAVDTLGELDARLLFRRCLDAATSAAAAEGWAGDRFVFSGAQDRLNLRWVSAWDSEQDAREAEAALRKSEPCFSENRLDATAQSFAIGRTISVQRDGDRVAFARGLSARDAAPVLERLLARVGPRLAPVPVSSARVAPARPLPEPTPGVVIGNRYQNAWLGLDGAIPPGMKVELGRDGIDLAISREGAIARGALAVSTRITTPDQNERTFGEVERGFATSLARIDLVVRATGGGAYQTPLGLGVARTWSVLGTDVELTLVLVPICGGTGSVVFAQIYGDAYAKHVLDQWLGTFRFVSERLVACDFLDPT